MTDLQSRIAALSPEQRALLESRVAGRAAARGPAQAERIRPRDRSMPTPLSFQQRREWALERFRPANNISGALRLEGDVDLDLLSRVVTEITARHEVLRSTVEVRDRVPVQVVHPVTPIQAPVVDLSDLDPVAQQAEVRRRFDVEVASPFPPEQPQRMRATVLKLAADKYVALLTIHHSSSDGWSMSIVVREAAALYRAFLDGGGASLPQPPVQYGDYAAWQRERQGEEWMATELAYWREVLEGIPPRLALPTDRSHPARRTFAGTHYTSKLSGEKIAALQQMTESENVSVSMVLLAVLSVMFYRYTGQDDIVIGSAVTGRNRVETEQLIGCFANVVALRMRVSPGHTLLEVLHQARDVAAAAFNHQGMPFDRLIEELAPRESSQTPLIQMMINVLTAPGRILRLTSQTLEVPGLRITPEAMDPGPIPIDLSLNVETHPDTVHLQWHYSTELFDAATVMRLASQFEHILDQLMKAPGTRIADVHLLGTEAPAASGRPAPQARAETGFVELFRRQVTIAPDAPAIVCDGVPTSYAVLNREANRLAHHLRALGVGPETRVGILLDSKPHLAAAVLGVLKAGGAYVPMDPVYPAERISFMLSDAQAQVLITAEPLAPLAAGAAPAHTVLMDREDGLPHGPGSDPEQMPAPASAAYIAYTSGSTGQPKGVVIEHRSLVTFAREVAERLQLGAGDRFLQFASPSFDVLAEELFPIWLSGGAVIFPPPRMSAAGIDLAAIAEKDQLSVVELPASYWHEWVRELGRTGRGVPSSLRLVLVGAERVLPERLAVWQKLNRPLLHVYGITETTVSSTFFRLSPDAPAADLLHLPIGTPVPSARLQILDSLLKPVPTGAVGELYIGGGGVARGYLGRPGLTAQRFVADPDPAHPGERVYRTGDLVRERADGNLAFLSRADAQIKIRGFRVEPAEIESAICRHPQVAQAVVTVRELAPGDRRLAAYLVPQARTRPNITDLRRFLGREIPAYLVPATFVILDKLPVTPNGKIDFERLPEPGGERPELDEELVLPRTELERQLAGIVAAVLGVTTVGANDNFFELGGDSILAIQVASRANEQGLPLSPLDMFEHPTIAMLAEAAASAGQPADAGRADGAEPESVPRAAPAPADFPLAQVDQAQLDKLLSKLAGDKAIVTGQERH
jgi:amino acid adenylation domain-containing protein